MIWRYKIPTAKHGEQYAYGAPVTVYVPGLGLIQAVYQFGTDKYRCAVVHLASGRIIAPIEDRHTGYPEQRARAACEERFRVSNRSPENIAAIFQRAPPVINHSPEVVGVLKRWPAPT